MTKKESESQMIQSIVNYLNNIRYDEQQISSYNDILSVLLGSIIDQAEGGILPRYDIISFIIDKAMETTKKDPEALPTKVDELKYWGERIFTLLMLPTRDLGCLSTFLKKFKSIFTGAKRRHYVQDNQEKMTQTSEMLKAFSFVGRKTYYPKGERKEEKGFIEKFKSKLQSNNNE
jgi:hypothetical protein